MVNGVGPMLAACLAGQGVAQILELYTREFLADGRLIQVLPEWAEETYPLYAYRHAAPLMSAKVRALDLLRLDACLLLTRPSIRSPIEPRLQGPTQFYAGLAFGVTSVEFRRVQ
jgi:LysR substrate binding domain-containing protein